MQLVKSMPNYLGMLFYIIMEVNMKSKFMIAFTIMLLVSLSVDERFYSLANTLQASVNSDVIISSKDVYSNEDKLVTNTTINVYETPLLKWEIDFELQKELNSSLVITENIPNYLTVDESSITPTASIKNHQDGSTTLKWNILAAEAVTLQQVSYVTSFNKNIIGETIVSTTSNIEVEEITKELNSSVNVETNGITLAAEESLSDSNSITYKLNLENTTTSTIDFEIWEIIPYNNEIFPTSAARSSTFENDFILESIEHLPNNTTILYAFEKDLNYSNLDAASFKSKEAWKEQFKQEEVTAIKFVVNDFTSNMSDNIELRLKTSADNLVGKYTNDFKLLTNLETTNSEVLTTYNSKSISREVFLIEPQLDGNEILLEKFVNKTDANVGETLNYTVKITNRGTASISGYEFSDILDFVNAGYAEVVETSLNADDGSNLIFDGVSKISGQLNDIAPNSTVTITFDVVVKSLGAGQLFSNTAVIENSSIVGSALSSNTVNTNISQLRINKSANLSSAMIGDRLTYTIVITNDGLGIASGYEFSDVLDFVSSGFATVDENSLTISDGSNIQFDGTDTISGTLNDLAPNSSISISFDVTIIKNSQTAFDNKATIALDNVENSTIESNVVSVVTPHLSITKAVSDLNAVVGETITYTITVKNDGLGVASGYIVEDELDFLPHFDLDFNSASASNGDLVDLIGESVIVELSDLAPGEEVVITFSGVVRNGSEGLSFTNDANVGLLGISNSIETSNSVTTDIPKLTINKMNNTNDVAHVGDTITYTITVTNDGPGTAEGFEVQDNLSSIIASNYAEFVSGSITVSNGASIVYDPISYTLSGELGDIASGTSVVITFQVKVLADGLNQTFLNKAVVEVPLYPESSQVSNTDIIAIGNVSILKSVSTNEVKIGEVIKYTIRIKNTENTVYDNYYFEDQLDFVTAGYGELILSSLSSTNGDVLNYDPSTATISSNMNDIPINTEVFITYEVKILTAAKGQSFFNDAEIFDIDDVSNTFVTSNNVGVYVDNIDITKSVNKVDASVGEVLIYTVTVTNSGPGISKNYVFNDQLDAVLAGYLEFYEWSITTSSGDTLTYNPLTATISGNLRTMYSGESIFIRFRAKVLSPAKGKTLTNVASINDPNFTNSEHVSNLVETRIADLRTTKAVDKTYASLGETIKYTVTITNDGPGTAIGYEFVDTMDFLSNNYAEVVGVPTASDGSVIIFDGDHTISGSLNDIVANSSVTITYDIKVLAAGRGRIFTNTASIFIEGDSDSEIITNEVATEISDVNASKAVNKTNISAGEVIEYTITVVNNGSNLENDYQIKDTMDFLSSGEAQLVAGPLASDGSIITFDGTDTISGTINELAPSEVVTITYSIKALVSAKGKSFVNNATIINPAFIETELVTNNVRTNIADVSLSKNVDKEISAVGGIITYTVTITNDGPGTAIGYEFVDTMDFLTNGYGQLISTPIASDGSVINFDGIDTISGTLNSIASGSAVTVTYQIKVLDTGKQKTFLNSGSISKPGYLETDANSNEVSTDIMDLEATKAVDISDASAGEVITYTITIKNNGPIIASGYELQDTMDFLTNGKAQLVSAPVVSDGSVITFDGTDTISGTLNDIGIGSSTIITYSVKASVLSRGEVFTNSARVINENYLETEVITNEVITSIADVKITKEVNKTNVSAGELILYTLKVTNVGAGIAKGYELQDTMDFLTNGYGQLVSDPVVSDGSVITFDGTDTISGTLNDIAPNATITITYVVKVLGLGKGKTFINDATVSHPLYPEVTEISNDVSTIVMNVAISKDVSRTLISAEGLATFTIEIKNIGSNMLVGYKLVDTMDFLTAGYAEMFFHPVASDGSVITFDGVDTISGTINDLAPGDKVIVKFTVKANVSGKDEFIYNEATIKNPLYPESQEVSNEVEVQIAAFIINKEVNKSSASVGEKLQYKIIARNLFNYTIYDEELTDEINTDFVTLVNDSVSISGGSDVSFILADDAVTIVFGEIAPLEEIIITFEVIVNEAARGQIICNDAAIALDTYFGRLVFSEEACTGIADIEITKNVDKQTARVGEEIEYELVIYNKGKGIAHGYVVTDIVKPLSMGQAILTSLPTASDGSVITFDGIDTISATLNDIDIGDSLSIKFKIKITEKAANQTFYNTASVMKPDYILTIANSNEVQTKIADELPKGGIKNDFLKLIIIICGLLFLKFNKQKNVIIK